MRQTLSRGVFAAAAAATGILSLYGSSAFADTHAAGAAEDPGVLSGNSMQVPVEVPVNLCGNTVDAFAALNHPSGNSCGNTSDKTGYGSPERDSDDSGDSGDSTAGTRAKGDTGGSSSPLSGNSVKVPVEVPVNVCGNIVDAGAVFNYALGNSCDNVSYGDDGYGTEEETPPSPPVSQPPTSTPTPPPTRTSETPPPTRTSETPPADEHLVDPPTMAETGSGGMVAASTAGAALIAGGVVMYRRGRAASHR
ncbi:chaplin [Streptomyces sp. NPDC048275]|uniref:chaplin n=1 Tax=Streptomyces sp. NPDC048275 TaxID=3155629 RepID=UPI0033CBABB0